MKIIYFYKMLCINTYKFLFTELFIQENPQLLTAFLTFHENGLNLSFENLLFNFVIV